MSKIMAKKDSSKKEALETPKTVKVKNSAKADQEAAASKMGGAKKK